MIKLKTILRESVGGKLTYENVMAMTPKDVVEYIGRWDGFNTNGDAIEEMDYLLNNEFPYGFKDVPPEVTLYRFLLIQDGEIVNDGDIGEHYIVDDTFVDAGFFRSIGIWDEWGDDSIVYKLICKTQRSNLNWDAILDARLNFPRENEYTVLLSKRVKVIEREICNKEDY